MSLSSLAAALKVSRPTLNKYRAEGCPIEDLEAAREWVAKRRASDGRGGRRDRGAGGRAFLELKESLTRANLRKVEAEAQLKEFEAEQAQKNLVSLDEAKAYVAEILGPLRVLLDSLPKSCAVKANPSDAALAEEAIREGIDGVFRAMDKVREDGGANGS